MLVYDGRTRVVPSRSWIERIHWTRCRRTEWTMRTMRRDHLDHISSLPSMMRLVVLRLRSAQTDLMAHLTRNTSGRKTGLHSLHHTAPTRPLPRSYNCRITFCSSVRARTESSICRLQRDARSVRRNIGAQIAGRHSEERWHDAYTGDASVLLLAHALSFSLPPRA